MKTKTKKIITSIITILLISIVIYSACNIISTSAATQKILCLGDSITYGYVSSTGGQLATPYPATLQSLTGISTTNAGFTGYRVDQILTQWNNNYRTQGYSMVILMAGTNDIGQGNTPLTTTEANLQTIWQDALNQGCIVYALTILPFGGANVIDLNNWIKSTAPTLGVHVIDTYSVFNDPNHQQWMNPLYDSGDLVHPNQLGANVLANTVYSGINSQLPTPTPTPTATPSPTPFPSPPPGNLVAYMGKVTVT